MLHNSTLSSVGPTGKMEKIGKQPSEPVTLLALLGTHGSACVTSIMAGLWWSLFKHKQFQRVMTSSQTC